MAADDAGTGTGVLGVDITRVTFGKCFALESRCIEVAIDTTVRHAADGPVLGRATYVYSSGETDLDSLKTWGRDWRRTHRAAR